LARQHDRKLANYVEIVLKTHVAEQRYPLGKQPAGFKAAKAPKRFRDATPRGTKKAVRS